jgi:4,5-dihydroxyphthalate decarboxylase
MIPLTIGCLFSDRIEALLDGRVQIAGADATIRCLESQSLFRQVLRDQAFDVAELSMGSHIAAVSAGRRDYVGLPVFLSRSFRHGNLYVRTDRAIDRPEDLAGKRIGLIDFQQTAAQWVRGILADSYGVARESIEWITAGLHAPVLADRAPMALPAGLRVTRVAATLDAMLADGTLDAVISPIAPRCFVHATTPVARMWPDARAAETQWWAQTGVFPIMHVAVVRRSLVAANPDLYEALTDAFGAALALALKDLAGRDFPKVAMPWVQDAAVRAVQDIGEIWTYGLDANRLTLELMLRHAVADGLATSDVTPEMLFA